MKGTILPQSIKSHVRPIYVYPPVRERGDWNTSSTPTNLDDKHV